MSQQDETTRTTGIDGDTTSVTDAAGQPATEGATVGTGTSLALGCVAGTILLIVIGLIYILILAIV